MAECYDCPRLCGADREKKYGYCGVGKYARIAKVISPFELEEPCLGRLTAVFFGGCNLRCSYCQNIAISRGAVGEEYDDSRLAGLFDGAEGALDLVTPTHCISAIERAAMLCKKEKRIIWNTSGYETVDGIRRASEICDVFLTDLKYVSGDISSRYSNAPDYFDRASRAIAAMRDKADEWENIGGADILKRGLVVRHLVLPGCAADSVKVLDFIAHELGTQTVISLMSQFTPNGAGEPSQRLKKLEYKLVAEHALKLGFKTGYFQDFDSADAKYTPEF